MAQGNRKAQALILLLLCACSGPGQGSGKTEDGLWQDQPDDAVGWLGKEPVTYGEVGRYIRLREPDVFTRSLTRYLLERVTMREAKPLGIEVPSAVLTRETSRRMRAWEARVRVASKEQTGQEIDPALWLQRVADLTVEEFRERVKEGAAIELTQDRLLRYELLTSRHIEVSILVIEGKQKANGILKRLKAGADLAAIAQKDSVHSSAQNGGRVPFPLVAMDINDAKVRDALFLAKGGQLLGPFPVPGGGFFQIYRIESNAPAKKGAYALMEQEVSRGLEARPVPVGEYERWRRRILLRHGFSAEPVPGMTRATR